MESHIFTTLLYIYGSFHVSVAQNEAITLDVHNLLNLQNGLGWPPSLYVAEGQEGLLKLRGVLDHQDSCIVTTPTGTTFDVHLPPSNRYESWSDGCGIRIRNVVESDTGRWKLNAKKGNDTASGWTAVFVEKIPSNDSAQTITIQDGKRAEIHLSSVENNYCVVEQPFSESTLVRGECTVTLDKASRAVQGNWNVLIGALGMVQEIRVTRQVAVEAEKLEFGYIHDTNANKLHLYCNILHSEKKITFCRFQRTNSAFGLNVMDGLGDGNYSYYGEGFIMKQCGITIEHPSTEDFASWRCSVGTQQWDGDNIATPLTQALITVVASNTRAINRNELIEDDADVSTVFVQEDESFTLMCRADSSLSYCWFQHPNGSQYTPVNLIDKDTQKYWYSGESLQVGDCGITFNHANREEEGLWTCHMAPRDRIGIEITDQIHVRVTGPLAANRLNVTAAVGERTTLYCHTANGNKPLDYCRFRTPQFVGLSVDSTVTPENAILDRFYFTPGRSLDYGDCSLTIDPLTEDDVGLWTCAALISGHSVEARDTLSVHASSSSSSRTLIIILSTVLPFLAIVLVLLGILISKYRLMNRILFKILKNTFTQSEVPMDVLSTNTIFRCSCGSHCSSSSEDTIYFRKDYY